MLSFFKKHLSCAVRSKTSKMFVSKHWSCFHILSVEFALRDPECPVKDKMHYFLSKLIRSKIGKEGKPGKKRPRPKDYDYEVDPPPDAIFPLNQKTLGLRTSTSKKLRLEIDKFSKENCDKEVVTNNFETSQEQSIEHVSMESLYPLQNKFSTVIQPNSNTKFAHLLPCLSAKNWLTDKTIKYAIRCLTNVSKNQKYLLWDYYLIT